MIKVISSLAIAALTLFSPAWGDVLVVTNTNDTGAGSLRNAIADAPADSTIEFATNLSGGTITLGGTQLSIDKDLTIDASSLPNGITIDANYASRIIEISSGRTVTLSRLTIINGRASGGGGILNYGILTINNCTLWENAATTGDGGGGIYNNSGTLILNNSTLYSNTAGDGAGIWNNNNGFVTLNSCTLYGNQALLFYGSATNYGGGIWNEGSTVTLNHCTLSGNRAVGGGGIYNDSGVLNLKNSIVADNTLSGFGFGPDIYQSLTVFNSFTGVNFIGDTSGAGTLSGNYLTGDPELGPLINSGGPTFTMSPYPGSPVIDPSGGDLTSSFMTDQRGLPRVVDGDASGGPAVVDIGAVESLQGAKLDNLDFSSYDLSYVNLSGVSLLNADLSSNDLSTTTLNDARYNLSTQFPDGFDFSASNMLALLTHTELVTLNTASVSEGESNVTSDPTSFGLYDESNVQDLAFGRPVFDRDSVTGKFTIRFQLQESPDLQSPWTPLDTMNLNFNSTTKEIEAEFDPPNANAYFYRLYGNP